MKTILITLFLSAFLIAAVVLAVSKIIKDKKSGKCSCGGQCSGCPMSGTCHDPDTFGKE